MLERMMKRAAATKGERTDDNITSFNKRYDTFNTETMVVLNMFEKRGLLRRVNVARTIDQIFRDTKALFAPSP